ncbi:Uncharacterised protein [uncultured archaeon]|nr:Uncharacterised protein [uncultured archaeon]
MTDLFEKLIKIFIGEFVEAIIFIILLLVAGALPNDNISKQLITMIIVIWAILGIGTPFVIFLEMEKEIINILKVIK